MHPLLTSGFPSFEKQWWRAEMYEFSWLVERLWVRHTEVQSSNSSFHTPEAFLPGTRVTWRWAAGRRRVGGS
jgi:hypothetical protein